METRFLLFALLLLTSPFLSVVRSQSDSEAELVQGSGDLGIVGDDVQDFGIHDEVFTSAPGIDTVCVFPNNFAKGDSNLNVIAIKASVHLPFNHQLLVQNLTMQEFYNASVASSVQATFPYIFAVSKYLQPGQFDLVGTIIYEIDQHPFQSTFYNGTIEVVEANGFLSIESVLLVTFAIALLVLLGLWIHGQVQHLSKKTKKPAKVEVGTGTRDASMDEWLQGTAFVQPSSNKSKKKK
ncbi:hypothetical protein Sjap_016773 [Stephania japonica]|uniref:Translocon-associated protein subunit alpha n=1 Tax=Stephania japonica TaxID=461633 RepID=A0AAP0NIM7_9MAGN